MDTDTQNDIQNEIQNETHSDSDVEYDYEEEETFEDNKAFCRQITLFGLLSAYFILLLFVPL